MAEHPSDGRRRPNYFLMDPAAWVTNTRLLSAEARGFLMDLLAYRWWLDKDPRELSDPLYRFGINRRKFKRLYAEVEKPYETLWVELVATRSRYIPSRIRRAVMERDEFTCQDCGATDDLALDHIYPFSAGGGHSIENLRVLCTPCNSRKGARIMVGEE